MVRPSVGSPDTVWLRFRPSSKTKRSEPNGALSWKNRASGLCMAVQGAVKTEGAALVQRPCTGGPAQLWQAVDRGIGGGFELVNVNSGMAVGFGADRVDGWRVLAQRAAGQPWLSRMWIFRPA